MNMEAHHHHHEAPPVEEVSYGLGMQSLLRSLRAAFIFLALLIAGMLLWYVLGAGYFSVKPQEKVLVFRFGKYMESYSDGWHWVPPPPISTIIRVPANQQTLVVSTFMPDRSGAAFKSKEEKAMENPDRPLVPGQDGHLVTGDENIIHTEWVVLYTVTNPEKYYFSTLTPEDPRKTQDEELFGAGPEKRRLGTRGPRTLLKNLLENAVVKVTASQKVEDSLYKSAGEYSSKVKAAFSSKVKEMELGIMIDDLILKTSSPPGAVKASFEEVTQAAQESQTMQNTAKTSATELLNEARAEAAQIIAEANAYKKRVVSDVESENASFGQLLARYNENPDTVLVHLYNQTLAEVMDSVKDNYVLPSTPGSQRQLRLKLNPEPPTAAKKPEKDAKKEKGSK